MKHREKITQGWEPWLTPMIPALRKLMEKISEFEASIGCIQDSLSYSMELYQQKMVLTDCWCGRAWLIVGSTTPGSKPELCRKASWAGACKQSSPWFVSELLPWFSQWCTMTRKLKWNLPSSGGFVHAVYPNSSSRQTRTTINRDVSLIQTH